MSTQMDDSGYRVLVEVAETLGMHDMNALLQDLYRIQKEHQFEKDRAASCSLMEKAILAEIDRSESQSNDSE